MIRCGTRTLCARRTSLAVLTTAMLVSTPPARAELLRDCEQLEDLQRAIRACSHLTSFVASSAALHNRRGLAYFRIGEIENAISDYTEAIRLDPNAALGYYNRGRALLERKSWPQAIFDFNEAINRNRKHALALNGRAWALLKLGNIPAALEEVNLAIAADCTYAPTYDTRAHVYEALGKRDWAIADFRAALALDPHDPLAIISREGLRRLGAQP